MKNLAILVLPLVAVVACKSIRSAKPKDTGFLGDYSILKKESGDASPELFWADADADWSSYTKVLLDPVTIWGGKNEKLEAGTKDTQRLANNFSKLLAQSLSKDYELVTDPGPDTLRIQVAITRLTETRPVMNVITSTIPQTHLLGNLESYAGIKPPFEGAAQVEMRATDGESGKVVMESVDRRIGTRKLVGSWESWGVVDDAMRFWSVQLVYMLCTQQGKANCVKPEV